MIFALLVANAVFAQGTPHTLVGYVQNSDFSIPSAACLTFRAYYLPDSDTLLYPEDSGPGEGTNYVETSGVWLVETSSFVPPAEDADEVFIEFLNICNDESAQIAVVLDMGINPQEVPMITLSDMAVGEAKLPEKAEIYIYPNPFNASCRIELPVDYSIGNVEIFDISGKMVRNLDVIGSNAIWDGLDESGESLPTGLYLIRVPGYSIASVMFLK